MALFVTTSFKNGPLNSEFPVLSQINVHMRNNSLSLSARVQGFKKWGVWGFFFLFFQLIPFSFLVVYLSHSNLKCAFNVTESLTLT